MRANTTSTPRRPSGARLWAVAGLTAALVPLGGAATAETSPAPAAAEVYCIPEAPVCFGIRGVPGSYSASFRIQPAPKTAIFSFTVNGAPAQGSLATWSSGTALHGDFRPYPPLVTGDRVCMRYTSGAREYCATTP
ncbi:hypothetical protein [Nonomuraea sp. SYSU D8015]|uniref:hypothetical protein n=1 Tax=Nonomuraea sp. SYSU D8015 TaxID=2593644 RepID=UPI001661423C|nr:hypothetical protein [Nonomuraea sp. SYSU D8015]